MKRGQWNNCERNSASIVACFVTSSKDSQTFATFVMSIKELSTWNTFWVKLIPDIVRSLISSKAVSLTRTHTHPTTSSYTLKNPRRKRKKKGPVFTWATKKTKKMVKQQTFRFQVHPERKHKILYFSSFFLSLSPPFRFRFFLFLPTEDNKDLLTQQFRIQIAHIYVLCVSFVYWLDCKIGLITIWEYFYCVPIYIYNLFVARSLSVPITPSYTPNWLYVSGLTEQSQKALV